MGRRGAGAQRSVAAWRRSAARQGAERIASSWQPITGRAWQHRGGAIPWQGVAASGRAITGRAWQQLAGDHRQGVASSWQPITGSRAARA